MNENFYTMTKYKMNKKSTLSESMEDYLEMITRIDEDNVKVSNLAKLLHVRSSSVTKMAQKLKEKGMISYEKYGSLKLTEMGRQYGEFLIKRHEILVDFFRLLNGTDYILDEVEQIEHYLSFETIENLEKLTKSIKKSPFNQID